MKLPHFLQTLLSAALILSSSLIALADGLLLSGQHGDDTITSDTEVDTWTFHADAGNSIIITLGELFDATGGTFTLSFDLIAPDSSLVGGGSGGTHAGMFLNSGAPQTGTYSIEVSEHEMNHSPASYRIHLAKYSAPYLTDDGGGDIVNGANYDSPKKQTPSSA